MDEALDLRRYWLIVRRWLWLIILLAVLAGGTAYFFSARQIPLYRATATLLMQPSSAMRQDYVFYRTPEQFSQTYIQMMTGRPVIQAAQAKLRETPPYDTQPFPQVSIGADWIHDTQLIRLHALSPDSEFAALYANTVVDAFMEIFEGMQQGRYIEAMDALQQHMEDLLVEMEDIQNQIDGVVEGTGDEQQQMSVMLLESTLIGYRNVYNQLVRDYEQRQVAMAEAASTVAIYESADVPQWPLATSKRRNTLMAAFLGAAAGVGLAFLIEYLDDTLKSPDDIRDALGLRTLGTISSMETKNGLITVDKPRSIVSEAFRVLRTNIRFAGVDRPLHTILVTSSVASEGKSTLVANLAVAMSQAGLRVLAIDADLRRPRLHQLFDITPEEGLTATLINGNPGDPFQQVGDMPNLIALASGDLPPNPAELLGSKRMKELLDAWSQHVDVILLDTPPLLAVTDAAVLAQNVDGVILVIETGKTRRATAKQALDRLYQVGSTPIGAVLNKVSLRQGRGYYHYYDNKYYLEDGEKTSRRRRRHRERKGPLAALRGKLGRN